MALDFFYSFVPRGKQGVGAFLLSVLDSFKISFCRFIFIILGITCRLLDFIWILFCSLLLFSAPARLLGVLGFGWNFVHEGKDIKIGKTRIGVLLFYSCLKNKRGGILVEIGIVFFLFYPLYLY